MKRKLVAAILGIAASASMVSSAHAQGRVFFNNYASQTSAPVFYGDPAAGTVGAGINGTYTAGLWYFLGTTSLAASTALSTPGESAPPVGWEIASVTQAFNTSGPGSEGFFVGPIAQITDYTTGPITFAVTAYNGTGYATGSTFRGHSAGFTLASIATGGNPTGQFGPGLTSFSVFAVPEPSIFALSGLGAAALMLIRRKK